MDGADWGRAKAEFLIDASKEVQLFQDDLEDAFKPAVEKFNFCLGPNARFKVKLEAAEDMLKVTNGYKTATFTFNVPPGAIQLGVHRNAEQLCYGGCVDGLIAFTDEGWQNTSLPEECTSAPGCALWVLEEIFRA